MTEQDFSAEHTAPDGLDATVDPAAITAQTPPDSTDTNRLADLDLAAIENDLDDVQAALARLADGTYWIDEVTAEPIPTDRLAQNPLARRA